MVAPGDCIWSKVPLSNTTFVRDLVSVDGYSNGTVTETTSLTYHQHNEDFWSRRERKHCTNIVDACLLVDASQSLDLSNRGVWDWKGNDFGTESLIVGHTTHGGTAPNHDSIGIILCSQLWRRGLQAKKKKINRQSYQIFFCTDGCSAVLGFAYVYYFKYCRWGLFNRCIRERLVGGDIAVVVLSAQFDVFPDNDMIPDLQII